MGKQIGNLTAVELTQLLLSQPWTANQLASRVGCAPSSANHLLQREAAKGFLSMSNAPRQHKTGTVSRLYSPLYQLTQVQP